MNHNAKDSLPLSAVCDKEYKKKKSKNHDFFYIFFFLLISTDLFIRITMTNKIHYWFWKEQQFESRQEMNCETGIWERKKYIAAAQWRKRKTDEIK